jgi:hypothetical protein
MMPKGTPETNTGGDAPPPFLPEEKYAGMRRTPGIQRLDAKRIVVIVRDICPYSDVILRRVCSSSHNREGG